MASPPFLARTLQICEQALVELVKKHQAQVSSWIPAGPLKPSMDLQHLAMAASRTLQFSLLHHKETSERSK
jgi:hypothetical protein